MALLPLTTGIIAWAGAAHQLIRLVGVRLVGSGGLAIAAVGMLLLTGISVQSSYASDFLPGLLVLSVGMDLTFVPITLLATSGVEARDAGLASGLDHTMSQVGGALGLAILSSVAASRTASILSGPGQTSPYAQLNALVSGFHVAYVAAAILLACAAAVLVVFCGAATWRPSQTAPKRVTSPPEVPRLGPT